MPIVPSGTFGLTPASCASDQQQHKDACGQQPQRPPVPGRRLVRQRPGALPHHDGHLVQQQLHVRNTGESLVRAAILAGQRQPVMGGGPQSPPAQAQQAKSHDLAATMQFLPDAPRSTRTGKGEHAKHDVLAMIFDGAEAGVQQPAAEDEALTAMLQVPLQPPPPTTPELAELGLLPDLTQLAKPDGGDDAMPQLADVRGRPDRGSHGGAARETGDGRIYVSLWAPAVPRSGTHSTEGGGPIGAIASRRRFGLQLRTLVLIVSIVVVPSAVAMVMSTLQR